MEDGVTTATDRWITEDDIGAIKSAKQADVYTLALIFTEVQLFERIMRYIICSLLSDIPNPSIRSSTCVPVGMTDKRERGKVTKSMAVERATNLWRRRTCRQTTAEDDGTSKCISRGGNRRMPTKLCIW